MLFQYEERARQLIDYANLSWKFIHPTDIDGCLEFDNYKLALLEYKTAGKEVDTGQRLLLERLANNWINSKSGNVAIVIVADHYTKPNEIVDGGNAIVRCVYYQKRWHNYKGQNRTVRSVIEKYAEEDIQRKISQPKD